MTLLVRLPFDVSDSSRTHNGLAHHWWSDDRYRMLPAIHFFATQLKPYFALYDRNTAPDIAAAPVQTARASDSCYGHLEKG